MRKLLVLPAMLLICLATIYVSSCNNEKKEPQATTENKDSLNKVIARGSYLANHVASCMDCHSKRDINKYSAPVIPGTEGGGGFEFIPAFGIPGTIYSKNITPDSATGIGAWTDDEIIRAVTQGISRNGDTLFPLMPYASFNRMAKEDLLSIIAYLRTLKPISNKVPPRQLMIPISAAYPAKFLQPSIDGNVRPAETDKVKYGEYLVTLASCVDCHTPVGPQGLEMNKAYSGGHVFDAGVFKVASANITSDTATGIGKWTEEAFLNKFIPYRDKAKYDFNPGRMNTVMPLSMYAGMTDDDLKAIYAYVKTIPPIQHKVEKYPK